MSMTLQYNYVGIDLDTGFCHSCLTTSYIIDNPAWIEVPVATDDYTEKYYNLNGDKRFYWDAEFTQLWEECPSHNV